MSVIVTDTGFAADDWTGPFVALDDLDTHDDTRDGGGFAVDVPGNASEETLRALIAARRNDLALVRIDFPSFADGRGFTLATLVRREGFTGRLRAHGHVIADQYAMARRVGFDEVEIDDALAERQPEDQWRARADWQDFHHQARLRG